MIPSEEILPTKLKNKTYVLEKQKYVNHSTFSINAFILSDELVDQSEQLQSSTFFDKFLKLHFKCIMWGNFIGKITLSYTSKKSRHVKNTPKKLQECNIY